MILHKTRSVPTILCQESAIGAAVKWCCKRTRSLVVRNLRQTYGMSSQPCRGNVNLLIEKCWKNPQYNLRCLATFGGVTHWFAKAHELL
ncbi:hypothetical protein ONE63_011205 [Megalurothrips usitatus]|uniref:Uncharacterized protein n=1 Tax=Megalurothrips usitatus TaxID=439358 RepID=A0AAV7WZY0_9NEOP|nr:hypothetical protein ONE63_011205 [Megalurothrips usitatus]